MPPSPPKPTPTNYRGESIVFVTGRLAEASLRETVSQLATELDFHAEVYVAKISVAALMTMEWLTGKLAVAANTHRVILPGLCRGNPSHLSQALGGVPVEIGPKDLRDLPEYMGQVRTRRDYSEYNIEILAEINHADQLSPADLFAQAERFRASGADVIDLGCTPGRLWAGVGEATRELVARGFRVSIDSFDATEVAAATHAGAGLVLSVNSSNVEQAKDWGAEVVVIPDTHQAADWRDQLARCVECLEKDGVRYRLDPVLDPIGFGFAQALGRYLETRRRFPSAELMMGIGNLTELTEVDSAGVNTLLIGFCQEVGIRSVLTTEVIEWAQSAVSEVAAARTLMHYAVENQRIPKHFGSGLVMLRDPKVNPHGLVKLSALQKEIRDPNFRIFAEGGRVYALNNTSFESSDDPFELFTRLGVTDPAHAFYLGWEMMKAHTALHLGKQYVQDQSLRWGLLTVEEESFHDKQKRKESP